MRADKVRDLDSAELGAQLREMTEQIYRLRFQILLGQTDGVKKYRVLRKDRARVLTVLRERTAKAGKG
ncbi:MAG TPA: 50S ribosomal protein L29 [Bryobacteraceae bacterium]|nr:50S ribosomal protein L29 [Bryobacteraceae bacterium]